ncbi:hypothetical protein ACN20G_28700 (plasmid) [Streptomyces sp. BI20]|uniref:hypothetical protein n=1 Tax=Streptomyces sp. BI20 TaxID=3403460 RepID=UPI003C77F6E5
MTARRVLGACGLACTAWGAWLLLWQPEPWRVLWWLAGALLAHDGFLAPFVFGFAALAAALGLPLRGAARTALLVAGSLTAVALPALLRPAGAANPTVVPLDYPRNWLLAMAGIALLTLAYAGVRAAARRGARRP